MPGGMAAITSNQTGSISMSCTAVVAIFLTVCYALDSWEVVQYNSAKLTTLLESNGFNLSTFHEYYVVTLNSTTQVSGSEVHERYVLINEIRGGMWKSCAVVSDNTMKEIEQQDIAWATDTTCVVHESLGVSVYHYQSGKFTRHMMTRTAQSCMIVSCICMTCTLLLGSISLIIKHVILSMVSATVCYASGLYQLFAFVLMVRRHGEAKEYLETRAIPVSLEDCIDVTYGNSAYVAIIGFVVAMFAGTFWIVHTNILRRAIKLYISETKYNLWCRM